MAKSEASVSMCIGREGSKCLSIGADVKQALRKSKAIWQAFDQVNSRGFPFVVSESGFAIPEKFRMNLR